MGATLILVLSLAVVLSLILVLLAELYCSLLLRRRSSTHTQDGNAAMVDEAPTQLQNRHEPSAPSLGRFYSHGVLNNAPRNFLFPSLSISSKHEQQLSDMEKNSQQLSHFLGAVNSTYSSSEAPAPLQVIRILSSTPPSPSDREATQEQQAQLHSAVAHEGSRTSSKLEHPQHLVYISNPIFDEEEHYKNGTATTPYATPDTSPSRLGNTSSSSDEEEEEEGELINVRKQQQPNPPLKELPASEASASDSQSHSINAAAGGSSSVSVTPCTSW